MARYNPLEGKVETPAAPAPKPRPRKPAAKAAAPVGEKGSAPIVKIAARVPQSAAAATVAPLTPAARHAARLPVATYAALLGTTDHAAARQSRDAFTGWLNARPEQADWRAAWSRYSAPAAVPAAPAAPALPWYMTSSELMFVCEVCHCSNHVSTDGPHVCSTCRAPAITERADTRYGLRVVPTTALRLPPKPTTRAASILAKL